MLAGFGSFLERYGNKRGQPERHYVKIADFAIKWGRIHCHDAIKTPHVFLTIIMSLH